jgi:hypothetical protein
MTRIMGDSVTVRNIPLSVQLAAGYDDGTFDNANALAARFPHIPNVLIDVNGGIPAAAVRDWETGDKSGNLETWVENHNLRTGKHDAVVYCNRSTVTEVRQLTGSQILGQDYWLWVATLDGTLVTPAMQPGLVACQDKSEAGLWDESVVFADWWFAPPTPPPPPPPVHGVQAGWAWCNKCGSLIWPRAFKNVCPAGGKHDGTGSYNYSLNYER